LAAAAVLEEEAAAAFREEAAASGAAAVPAGGKFILGWTMKLLSDKENSLVESAIEAAELKTSGEIVFVIADASGLYRHAAFMGALVGMAVVTAISISLPFFPHTITNVLWTEFLSFAFFYAALPHLPWRRWFISKKEMDARVHEAAFMQFYASGLYRTRDSNGIEIFLSVFEKEVVVIGDRGINEKMGEQHWQHVRDLIIQGIRRGEACAGICAAIESCAQALAQHFPIRPDDVNELPNRVIHRPLNPKP
jgi:putative membrane protein